MQRITHIQFYVHQIAKNIKSLTIPILEKINTTKKLFHELEL